MILFAPVGGKEHHEQQFACVIGRVDRGDSSCDVGYAAAQAQTAKKDAPPKRIAIRAGRLIDGKSDSAIQNAVIVIEGDKIVSVNAGGARSLRR